MHGRMAMDACMHVDAVAASAGARRDVCDAGYVRDSTRFPRAFCAVTVCSCMRCRSWCGACMRLCGVREEVLGEADVAWLAATLRRVGAGQAGAAAWLGSEAMLSARRMTLLPIWAVAPLGA